MIYDYNIRHFVSSIFYVPMSIEKPNLVAIDFHIDEKLKKTPKKDGRVLVIAYTY